MAQKRTKRSATNLFIIMMQSNPVNTETKGAIKKVSILTGVLIKQVEF